MPPRHDLHLRKLLVTLISHADVSDPDNKIVSSNIISYNENKALDMLDLVTRQWVEDYVGEISGGAQTSLIISSADQALNWQNDVSTDDSGNPDATGATWAEKFGNTPVIQIWNTLDGTNYDIQPLPISMSVDGGGNIGVVTIPLQGFDSRIIIK